MHTILKYEVPIPEWAVNYLVNGDPVGLSGEDRQVVDEWYQLYLDMLEPDEDIILSPRLDGRYFLWYPEFGLASNVEDFDVVIVKREALRLV